MHNGRTNQLIFNRQNKANKKASLCVYRILIYVNGKMLASDGN